MKVYVLICDATDYNGERSVVGVYASHEAAQSKGDWETEKAQDWVDSMRESGDNIVGNWVPSFHVEEAEFYND